MTAWFLFNDVWHHRIVTRNSSMTSVIRKELFKSASLEWKILNTKHAIFWKLTWKCHIRKYCLSDNNQL